MNIFIYNKECEIVAKPIVTSYNDFMENPTRFYPSWTPELIATDREYSNPILEDGFIREKTREEMILEGQTELLVEGEYIENGKILFIEKPTHFFKPIFNRDINMWEEGITYEEKQVEMDRLIAEFINLMEEKEKLIKYGFSTDRVEVQIEENVEKRNRLELI